MSNKINISCQKCKNMESYKLKIEKIIKILEDDVLDNRHINLEKNNLHNDLHNDLHNNNHLYESVIIEKNCDGNIYTYIDSNLGDNYLLLETGKNLDELDNIEIQSLNEQNTYKKYLKLVEYTNDGNYAYGLFSTVAKVGSFFIGFF